MSLGKLEDQHKSCLTIVNSVLEVISNRIDDEDNKLMESFEGSEEQLLE